MLVFIPYFIFYERKNPKEKGNSFIHFQFQEYYLLCDLFFFFFVTYSTICWRVDVLETISSNEINANIFMYFVFFL